VDGHRYGGRLASTRRRVPSLISRHGFAGGGQIASLLGGRYLVRIADAGAMTGPRHLEAERIGTPPSQRSCCSFQRFEWDMISSSGRPHNDSPELTGRPTVVLRPARRPGRPATQLKP
jgi:hypothetical protein